MNRINPVRIKLEVDEDQTEVSINIEGLQQQHESNEQRSSSRHDNTSPSLNINIKQEFYDDDDDDDDDDSVGRCTEVNHRFNAIQQIGIQKTQTSKSDFIKNQQPKSFDHISHLLNDYNIKYDKPLSVEEIAAKRAERILKDKQAAREQQAREQRELAQIKAQLSAESLINSSILTMDFSELSNLI